MRARIITIGDEILLGQTLDTNSTYIATALTEIGIQVEQMLSIQDGKEAIENAIADAMKFSEVVIMTGGLGPTRDDITKGVLAEYFSSPLEFNTEAYALLEDLLARRGFSMNENNHSQAFLPKGCKVFANLMGTASGMCFEKDGKVLISMPGVPFEMEHLMQTQVVPYLSEKFPSLRLEYRILKVYDVPESELALFLAPWEDAIPEGFKLAYLPSPGEIKLRITSSEPEGIDELFLSLQEALEGKTFTLGNNAPEQELGALLAQKGKTIAVAESCTGGNIAHLISSVAGCSEYFLGSVTSYANEVKVNVLGVNSDDLARFGAVSESTVKQMAEGVRKALGSDYALASSGVAGPGGGTEFNPVGTVWLAFSSEKGTVARKFKFSTDRARNITKASIKALQLAIGEII